MSNANVFSGSKRQRRERQRSQAFQRRLNRIMALAHTIHTDEEYRARLAAIEDDTVRAEVAKLLEPLLPFRVSQIALAPGERFREISPDGRAVLDTLTGKPLVLVAQ